jgi:hypothetical protein
MMLNSFYLSPMLSKHILANCLLRRSLQGPAVIKQHAVSNSRIRRCHHLLGSSLHKLLKVLHRRNAQDKPPLLISNDSKLLLPGPVRNSAAEETFELLESGLHGNDLVGAALTLESCHGGRELVVRLDLSRVEQRLQMRDREVTQKSAGFGVGNRQVRVFALEGM